jgi:tetratricopeptide (TPR) repeat protein
MYVQLGEVDSAFTELKAAEVLAHAYPELLSTIAGAYYALDAAYGETRHYSKAQSAFLTLGLRVAEILPDDAALRLRLGEVLMRCHQHGAARGHLLAATEAESMRERAFIALLKLLIDMGDTDQTADIVSALLEMPDPHSQAYLLASRVDAFTFTDLQVKAMEELMETAHPIPAEGRADIGFALGRHFDRQGSYDIAFHWFTQANEARKSLERGDVGLTISAFENVIERFPASVFDELVSEGSPTARPIFVVGMPRSGTTLIERILDSHPEVTGAGELADVGRIGLATEGRAPTAAQAKEMRAAYEEALDFHCPGAVRVVDKMPRNFINLGLIHTWYPDAIILHCRRDPVATCFSNFVTDMLSALGGGSDLSELGTVYRAYEKLMAHWKAVLPANRLVEVSYEALIETPEAEMKRMLEACGLDWDPACLSFHTGRSVVRTASVGQVRQQLQRDANRKWRKYEAHMAPLLDALQVD